jgi:uncharacterized hydrophobic protein (TIGR00271 family)
MSEEVNGEQNPGTTAITDGPVQACYLLHDSSLVPSELENPLPNFKVEAVPFSQRNEVPAEARVLLFLGDEQVRDLVPLALEKQWEVGLLPHPEAHKSMAAMGVKDDVPGALVHYASADSFEADAVTCNGELVFSSVVIGKVLALRPYDINRPQTTWSMLRGAFKGLTKMRLSPYSITTGKERSISLAALGLVCVGNTQSSLVGRSFEENLSITDGQMSMLALAPRSILGYLWFLLRLVWPGKLSLSSLPGPLALIQSDRLLLQAHKGVEYLLDGKPVHAPELEFQVLEGKLKLLPGVALARRTEEKTGSGKEAVRLNEVPTDDAAKALQGKPLPLFRHATESEYRELFVSLRDNAAPTSSYQVLMVLSVMLALTGLYANSAPVIIGAMILAPLMAPIVSFAMGLARSESTLIKSSAQTLAIGIAWGLGVAILFAWAMPLDIPSSEMKARMSPTLLDLLVAVVSGVAGAYAYSREEIAKSLAGVAIAVALVPPLSVAGIGLGWGDWGMAYGALLLFITNLVGIALAGSITFLVLGFAPFERARKGVGWSLMLMLFISAPLFVAFQHLVEEDWISEQVPAGQIELEGVHVYVGEVQVTVGNPHLITVVLSAPEQLDASHVDALKELITRRVAEPVELEARLHLRR